jgi:hypothetical protein
MSAFLPAPSTIVVLSLSIVTRLARPRSFERDVLELDAEVLGDRLPPVRMAMSFSIALRRSPKPGALTAQTLQRAAQLVDDQRGERLALDVLGDDQQRLAARATCSSSGSRSFMFEIFFSWIRMYASSSTTSMRSASVTKYGDR